MKMWMFTIGLLCALYVRMEAQHTLPKLAYDYKALEPYIDAATMEIHYIKHHQSYVTNLNNALSDEDKTKSLEQLLAQVSNYSDAVRNNAGGHYNHSLFWTVLSPDKGLRMSPDLEQDITATFGSVDAMKAEMNKQGATRFGSGWVWLIVNQQGKLQVCSTPNQDNPLMDISPVRGIPILGLDVWEHAYYLKYQNKRNDYLQAIWQVVNWKEVSYRYYKAMEMLGGE